MHPDLLRALAEARHQDLLDDRRTPRPPRIRRDEHFPRTRQRVGSLLIWAGARLMGDRQAALELANE
jgi:hypothetical protein